MQVGCPLSDVFVEILTFLHTFLNREFPIPFSDPNVVAAPPPQSAVPVHYVVLRGALLEGRRVGAAAVLAAGLPLLGVPVHVHDPRPCHRRHLPLTGGVSGPFSRHLTAQPGWPTDNGFLPSSQKVSTAGPISYFPHPCFLSWVSDVTFPLQVANAIGPGVASWFSSFAGMVSSMPFAYLGSVGLHT